MAIPQHRARSVQSTWKRGALGIAAAVALVVTSLGGAAYATTGDEQSGARQPLTTSEGGETTDIGSEGVNLDEGTGGTEGQETGGAQTPPREAAASVGTPGIQPFAEPGDIQPLAEVCTGAANTACLTINKNVVNTGGGTAQASDWTFTVTQQRRTRSNNSWGAGWGNAQVLRTDALSGDAISVPATSTSNAPANGTVQYRYRVTENTGGPANYNQTNASNGCGQGNNWNALVNGGSSACTITNTYQQPARISVTAGGDRTGTGATGSVLGVAPIGTIFQAVWPGGSNSGSDPGTGPFECEVTTSTGSCIIEVPGGSRWDVSVKSVPAGWFTNPTLGTSATTAPNYIFRTTNTVSSGSIYSVTASGTSQNWPTDSGQAAGASLNDNLSNRFTGDRLAVSRSNPKLTPACGLNVAFVLDQSNSMADLVNVGGTNRTRNWILKEAMTQVIDGLVGTPTQFAMYTYASNANSNGGVGLTSLATATSAQPLKTFINGLANAPSQGNLGGTNWDRGLAQVQIADPAQYDLVVFFTDGMPTFYDAPYRGPGGSTQFQLVEQAIFSANAIKAKGVPVYGIGAGIGTGSGAEANLRAVTGETNGQDFFVVTDNPTEVVNRLRELAGGACDSTLTIQKQIQDHDGTLITPSPEDANGWVFANTITGAGNTIEPSATTDAQGGQNGFAVVPFQVAAGQANTVEITETLQGGYTFVGAQCSFRGQQVTTNVDPDTGKVSFQIPNVGQLPVGTTILASCVFTNQRPAPAVGELKIVKKFDESVPEGSGLETGFTGNYECVVGDETVSEGTWSAQGPNGATLTKTSGADPDQLPSGAVCTATEHQPSGSSGLPNNSWEWDTYSVDPEDGVTIVSDESRQIEVTNSAKRVYGAFQVTKAIELPDGETTYDDDLQFNGTWICVTPDAGEADITGTWTVTGEGTQVVNQDGSTPAKQIPLGSTCTSTETQPAGGPIALKPWIQWNGNTIVPATGVTAAVEAADATITVKNHTKLVLGSVEWAKVNMNDAALTGSEWVLSGPDGFTDMVLPGDCVEAAPNPVNGPYCLADDNEFVVGGLIWGVYVLTETKAPVGHVLPADPTHEFTITGPDGLRIELDPIRNEKQDGPDLPLTGGQSAALFTGLGLLILGGAGGAALIARRRRVS